MLFVSIMSCFVLPVNMCNMNVISVSWLVDRVSHFVKTFKKNSCHIHKKKKKVGVICYLLYGYFEHTYTNTPCVSLAN